VKKKPDTKFLKALGSRIRTLRTEQGISQNQLAFEIDMRREQIIRIEFGTQNTGTGNLKKIADTFEIPLKILLDFEY
jgi:transcriptional regulator with XRE-family HTH domain